MNTYEYYGENAKTVARLLDPMLVVVALVIAILVLVAHHHARIPVVELLALSTFAMALAMIVFNKVGSPQFTVWLAAPLVLSFAVPPELATKRWTFPLAAALAAAGLTQLVFPLFYLEFLNGSLIVVMVGALRNILLIALFFWTVRALVQAGWPTAKPTGPALLDPR